MISATPVVPDRFENLERKAPDELGTIVVPVAEGLSLVDNLYARMRAVGRGAFLVLRGESGAGKSTFLHTLSFFRDKVRTVSVAGDQDVRGYFRAAPAQGDGLIVHVLEEREALKSYTDRELEEWLHAINGYIRSSRGENALVVWPCNTDDLRDRIIDLAQRIGAETLLGTGDAAVMFTGPSKDQYIGIAERTLSTLNQGSSLSDMGLTHDDASACAEASTTIGGFMTRLSEIVLDRSQQVQKLVEKEQCRLWIVVAAGNDPVGDVNGLTRGQFAAIDTERLMTSTGANIVADLKKYPDKIGLLGNVLDARILHLPVLAASEIMRAFGSDSLRIRMKNSGLQVAGKKADAIARLQSTELASIFRAGGLGTLTRGKKLGSSSVEAFTKLAEIASTNDVLLNRALGEALVAAGLIKSYEVEKDFGSGLTRTTDILAQTETTPIRIEVMWRRKSGRADIANYTLTKLANYGKAIGYLD